MRLPKVGDAVLWRSADKLIFGIVVKMSKKIVWDFQVDVWHVMWCDCNSTFEYKIDRMISLRENYEEYESSRKA